METRRDVIVRTAVLADELGYEIFALPEGWGLDPAPVLAEIALRTARIHLASAILSAPVGVRSRLRRPGPSDHRREPAPARPARRRGDGHLVTRRCYWQSAGRSRRSPE